MWKKVGVSVIKKNDKNELIKLMQENPDLPVVFLVNNDDICNDFGSTVMMDFQAHKRMVYFYEKWGYDNYTDDIDEVIEYYCEAFADDEEYEKLSDKEYEKEIKKYIEENVEHYEAIVVFVY